jgi:lipopolysaccharide/colanic/teichoic acid biosynthesis glycosyltransferase
MSLVGPRPLYMSYNKKFSNFEMQRLNVKPGITGLAQIKVIDTNNWRSKFKYDVFYTKHKSISFDLYILCKTLSFYLNLVIGNKIIIENHNRFDD